MKGILLAGGRGERLSPLTDEVPKVMLPIAGKPVLEYSLRMFLDAGFSEIIVAVYHKSEVIIEYLKRQYPGAPIAIHKQCQLLGSAGDFKSIPVKFDSTFVVAYADNFSNCRLGPALDFHKAKAAMATVVLFDRSKNPNSAIAGGCVRLQKDGCRLAEFIEGQGALTDCINAGIYVCQPEILQYIPDNAFSDFGKDIFPLMLQRGENICGYIMPEDEFVFGIDTPDCYARAQEFYRQRLSQSPEVKSG